MASDEMDIAAWHAVATAISAAMAAGVIAPDDAAWRTFERIRRAVAITDLARAAALLVVLRRLRPSAYACFVARFADGLPPALRPPGGSGPPASPSGGTTASPVRGDTDGVSAGVTQPARGPAERGES